MGKDYDPSYVLAAGAVFLPLCSLVVALRFYVRRLQQADFGIDDWLCLPALIMVIGCAIVLIVGVRLEALGYPTPPHSDYTSSRNFAEVEKLEWSLFCMSIVAMGFIKTSFLFFFRRIFVLPNRYSWENIVSWALIAATIAWTIAFLGWFLFSCAPNFTARWNTVASLHEYCPTDLQSDIGLAVSDFVLDVFVVFLPVYPVLRLRMSLRKKVLVLSILLLGLVALAASMTRLIQVAFIVRVAQNIISAPEADENLLTTQSLYWTTIECGLALIACCLPTLHSLTSPEGLRGLQRLVSWNSFVRARGSGDGDMTLPSSHRKTSRKLSATLPLGLNPELGEHTASVSTGPGKKQSGSTASFPLNVIHVERSVDQTVDRT